MIRRPPRSTQSRSSAASDVYKRQPLKGFGGAGVLEIIEDFDGNAFRTMYTVRFADAVYVLHAFQKRSKRGIKTPKREMDVVRARLRMARDSRQAEADRKEGKEI